MAFCPFRPVEVEFNKTKEKSVQYADCSPDCALCITKTKTRHVFGDPVECKYDYCAFYLLALKMDKLDPDDPEDPFEKFKRKF